MDKIKHLTLTLDKSQERGYIEVPFQVEKNTERIDIRYRYPSSPVSSEGDYCISGEPCTIDLAVMLPDGTMAGASGSDRNHGWLSPLGSSAGFLSGELSEGTWHIIAGAYLYLSLLVPPLFFWKEQYCSKPGCQKDDQHYNDCSLNLHDLCHTLLSGLAFDNFEKRIQRIAYEYSAA